MHRTGKAIAALLLLWCGSAMANLTATVDRNQVTELELVSLTIRLTDATATGSPDFSVLEQNFDIVSQSGPNRSSRFVFINGQQTSESHVEWTLTLRPRKLGNLTIPSFELGGERTVPIALTVTRASAETTRRMNQFVFFDTSVDTTSTYVQGQIIYSVKLYYVDAISGDFPPPPDLDDAVIETVEAEKRYEAIVESRRFYVLEKRYAIYPQKSGELVIPRETFTGTRGRGGFFSARERVSAVSDKHVVEVKPRPAGFTGKHWLPATAVDLAETWNQVPKFKVGEPVNRTLSISATGLASSLLPPFEELDLAGAKTYQDPPTTTDTPTADGVRSTLTTTIGIVPTQPGPLTLPEIRIPWWNTRTNQMEVATIAAQTFEVAPAAAGITNIQIPTPRPRDTAAESSTLAPDTPQTNIWLYASGVLALLWLGTLYLWWSLKQRIDAGEVATHDFEIPSFELSEHNAFDALSKACKQNDPAAARGALFLWGQARYPHIRSLADLAHVSGDAALKTEVEQLDAILYAPDSGGSWQGEGLLALVKALRKTRQEKKAPSPLLESLNPT